MSTVRISIMGRWPYTDLIQEDYKESVIQSIFIVWHPGIVHYSKIAKAEQLTSRVSKGNIIVFGSAMAEKSEIDFQGYQVIFPLPQCDPSKMTSSYSFLSKHGKGQRTLLIWHAMQFPWLLVVYNMFLDGSEYYTSSIYGTVIISPITAWVGVPLTLLYLALGLGISVSLILPLWKISRFQQVHFTLLLSLSPLTLVSSYLSFDEVPFSEN